MNTRFRLPGIFALLASAALVSTSCDSKSNSASPTDPLTTNFSVNMTSLMEAIGGKPDSIVAEVQVNGSPVQTLNLDPGKISESGLVRFPVEAAEGSKIQVVYKVWAGGGVVGAGSVTWVSGEALTVPRPNLAPSVSLDGVPGKILLVRRNAKIWVHSGSRDPEGALASLLIDWNGDGIFDDSLVPPKGQDSIQVSWGASGTYKITAKLLDKAGLFRIDTLDVRVLSAATVQCSAPDSTSIRDTVTVGVAVAFDDSTQTGSTRLVWSQPGAEPETTAVVASRSFVWPIAGSKTMIVSTVDTLGVIDRDTVTVNVLQDAPILDLSGFPGAVDLNTIASLKIKVVQSFGTIVAWGVDFGGHPEIDEWDTTGTGPISSVSHVFTSSGDPRVRVWVEDDDGNRVVGSGTLTVNASTDGAMLRRTSPQDTTVSIHDTTVVQFVRNFPPGAEATSQVEWIIDGAPQAPTPVAVRNKFHWLTAGADHFVAWRLVTTAGTTTWDTISVRVQQDAPILDLSKFPRTAGLDTWTTFRPTARQTWGSIVQWGVDFDGDTANGWDVVRDGEFDTLDRVFDREGFRTVRVFATDDDGNRSVASAVVDVQPMESFLVDRISPDRDSISINDLSTVRFRLNFPSIATRRASRIVWTIDGAAPESLAVDTSRALSWSVVGRHVARMRVVGPLGTTGEDSVVVQVVQGVPTIDLGAFPDTAGSGSKTLLAPKVLPNFGTIVRWKIDYDGDTASGWDSVASGPAPGEIYHSFSQEGDSLVSFWVEDDDGNTAVAARKIAVVKGTYGLIQTKMGSDTTVSIGDTAWVRLFPGFSDLSEQSRSRLVWKVDWSQPETLQVVTSRGFRMLTLGKHQIIFRAIGEFGATRWDTLRVSVVLDPPVLDFGIPDVVGRNAMVTFVPGVRQAFGSITSWGMDLDGDTTSGWGIQGGSAFRSISRIFPDLGEVNILMWAIDDDGNRVVSSKTVQVRSGSGAVLALPTDAPREVTASINDSVLVNLLTNFDAESGPLYKLEWRIDGTVLDSTLVATKRTFRWDTAGDRLVSFRAIGPTGPTSWDSVLVHVLQDRPTVELGDLPVQPTRNAVTLFTPTATDGVGRIARWGLDFDADTSSTWDMTGTGEMVKVGHVFPRTGAARVLAFVEDDDGNRVVSYRDVVVKAGRGAISSLVADTIQASIGDTVLVKLAVSFPVGGDLQNQYSLEWKVDALPAETKAIVESRAFLWTAKGNHVIRFRAVGGPWGDASWDSIVVQVLQGAPKVLNIFRTGSGVNTDITFSANVDPVFGSIVAGRWDWENDGVWDAEVGNPTTQGALTRFATSTPRSIRFQATDDDGNVVDTVFVFSPSNAAPAFGIAGFVEPSVGKTISATLRTTFADPDGVSDLVSLSIDWNADGTWDTVRNIAGLSSDEVRRSWTTTGTKQVRLLLTDKSGATALATVSIVVRADAPRILSFLEEARRSTARIGDTLWFVASVADSSLPADLDSIRWSRDGKPDTVLSLRGRSAADSRIPVFSSTIGTFKVKAVVRDLVGNRDSAETTWRTVVSPPFVKIRLRDSILNSRDTVHLFLDSLRTGSMGGKIASASWAFRNGGWNTIPSPAVGGSLVLSLPAARDSLWYVVVRAVQDNGEVDYDTARANLLETFVDKRNGKVYPVIRVGKNAWMAKNLDWIPGTFDTTVKSSCPDGLGCEKLGRLYKNMGPLYDQIVSAGAPVQVSVCPDGWRMPLDEDFNDLLSAAYRVEPSRAPQMLRARTGWQTPLARQADPIHFAALPTSPSSNGEAAEWWFYDQGGWRGDWDARILNSEELTWGAPSLPGGASVRCVRLKEILVDSSWRRDGTADSGTPITATVRAYVPDSSAPVRIRVTFQGRVSEVVVNPVDHKVPYTTITYPSAIRIGRELVLLEIEQSGVVARDSHWIAIKGEVYDERESLRYKTARIGDQTWMARSVDYRGAGFLFYGEYPFANSVHYTLDQMMGGTAPEEGIPTGSRGICPDGFHIPSLQEWHTMVDAVTADGLDPKTALRQDDTRWLPGMPKGTNSYGFDGYPDGYYDGDALTWMEGSFYLAADATGYSLFELDNRSGGTGVDFEGPFPRSTIANLHFALRCVKNP